MLTLAERIAWILSTRSISARQLALRSKVSPNYISLLLKGERGSTGLTHKTAVKIATGGEVDLHWLLTGEGQPIQGAAVGGDPPPLQQALALLKDRLSQPVKDALRAERPNTPWAVEEWIARGLHLQQVYDNLPPTSKKKLNYS